MIECAYFSMGGAAVSLLGRTLAFKGFGIGLFQSESGGWEVDAERLPWCGALGDELRADDALDARDRERAQIEAAERARLDRRKRERLDHPPRTTAQARAEAMHRLERASRAADEDR